MSIKIYVGNLAYTVSESEIRDLFAPFGEVESVKIITDRETGGSKGFGFVEMPNRGEGEQAIAALNEQMIKNRAIKVNEARPRPAKEGFGGGGGRKRSY